MYFQILLINPNYRNSFTKELIAAVTLHADSLPTHLIVACFSSGSSFSFYLESLEHDAVKTFLGFSWIVLRSESISEMLSHKEYFIDCNLVCF